MPRGRAEADLQNKDGRTALKYARMLHQDKKIYGAELIQPRIVALLLKAGARE
jgi:hypothetical protein